MKKYILVAYKEDKETKAKMDKLLPKQKMSEFIRSQTKKGIKNYANKNPHI